MLDFIKQWQADRRERKQYTSVFGWKHGNRILRKLHSSEKVVSFRLPQHRCDFTLRPGTTDTPIFEGFFLKEPYILPRGMKPGLIIDAGANIGCASVFFAKKYRDARIISIEPDQENYELCRKNTDSFKNVRVINGGLWPHDGFIKIQSPDAVKCGFRVEESNGGSNLRALSIPTLLAESGFEQIDILKMDIEGAEKELFSENIDWIRRVKILIIELHDRFKPGCAMAVYKALTEVSSGFVQEPQGENVVLYFD